LEPTVAGVRHDCSEIISALRDSLRSLAARAEDVDALEAFLDADESRSMAELAKKLVAYLKGGK
jgi:hypothetical protein